MALVLGRYRRWLDRAAVLVYGVSFLSAAAAALTGELARRSVSPGLDEAASRLVELHGDSAFFAVVLLFAAGALRFELLWRSRGSLDGPVAGRGRLRYGALAVSFLALWVLWSTASRGGALVYRHGIGVSREDME